MDLRTFYLLSLTVWFGSSLAATPVRRYPLDDRRVYALHVSERAPTTVIFPGPITALEGAGVSVRSEDHPGILISHQAGTAFFSLRALQAEASGALNVIYENRIYALSLDTTAEPDRTLTFYTPTAKATSQVAQSHKPDRLLNLLDRARSFGLLISQYPALGQGIEHAIPATTVIQGKLSITVEEIFRFEAEDALVLHARLENHGSKALHYDSGQLEIQVGANRFPVALTDATGALPAQRATRIALVLIGQPGTPSAGLSVKNNFELRIPFQE